MKITKNTLKQLIKEELNTVLEQQPPRRTLRTPEDSEDEDRQKAEIARVDNETIAADLKARQAAHGEKYGGRSTPGTKRRLPTNIVIDMLTKLTDMVEQLLQKP